MARVDQLPNNPSAIIWNIFTEMVTNIITWGLIFGLVYWFVPSSIFGMFVSLLYTVIALWAVGQNLLGVYVFKKIFSESSNQSSDDMSIVHIIGIFVIRFFESLIVTGFGVLLILKFFTV